jgi:prepilin-type N-terminal cleavage/methylation domain-containing protein
MIKKYEILNSKYETKKGFTVLESVVAISILSVAIAGAFTAIQTSLSQSTIAKDEVKAFYLAQEATEIIRNKRDNNQLLNVQNGPTVSWLDGITEGAGSCPFSTISDKHTCTVDAVNFQIADCGGDWGSCSEYLKQDPNTLLYSYTSGNQTVFKREIQIELVNTDSETGEPSEIAVTVRVYWVKGLITKEFKAKTLLFDWI